MNKLYKLCQMFCFASMDVEQLRSSKQIEDGLSLEEKVFKTKDPKFNKEYKLFGIYDKDNLIAMAKININPLKDWETDDNYDYLEALQPNIWISTIAVDPEYRGKGYGTKLMDFLQAKYNRILCGTDSKVSDENIIKINEKAGFKKILERGKNKTTTIWFWEKKI